MTPRGGEFDTVLALHGLHRSDICDDLIPLARIPRLLELVIRLKDNVSGVGRITIHGLLSSPSEQLCRLALLSANWA